MAEARLAPWRAPHLVASLHLLRGAVLASLATAGVGAVVAHQASGGRAAISVLAGAAAVIGFFGAGLPIQLVAMGQDLPSGIGLVIVCYASRVALLGMVLVALSGRAGGFQPAPDAFALAVVATTCAWVAGMLLGHARARIPVYDARPTAPSQDGV